jgi:putative ATP-dependent endonuclease of OLD family
MILRIEIVNLGGVAFEHFAKLFNSENPSERLSSRCAILTDDDCDDNNEISSRAEKAKEFQNGQLRVELAEKTFEYTLFKAGLNHEILLEIFREMHPVAFNGIEPGTSLDEYACNFLIKVESNRAKSELSYRLALRLENDADAFTKFTVPEYIKNAIRWVTKGE